MKVRLVHKIIFVGVVPLAAFLISTAGRLSGQGAEYRLMKQMLSNIRCNRAASVLIRDLQRERGRTALYLSGGSSLEDVKTLQAQSDLAFDTFELYLRDASITAAENESAAGVRPAVAKLRELYSQPDASLRKHEVKEYTGQVRALMQVQAAIARTKTTKGFGKVLTSMSLLEEARESAGLLRAHGSSLFSLNAALTADEFSTVLSLGSGINANLVSPALVLSDKSRDALEAMRASDTWSEVDSLLRIMMVRADRGGFNVSGDLFFKRMTQKIDDIGSVIEMESEAIVARAKKEMVMMRNEFTLAAGIILTVVVFMVLFMVFFIRNVVSRLATVSRSLDNIAKGEGDLTIRLDSSADDEIGDIALSFNEFVDKIQYMVQQVRRSAQGVAKSAGSMHESTEQVTRNTDSTAHQSKEVVDAAGAMTHLMSEASANMGRTAESLSSVATATEEMSATIADVSENAQKAMTIGRDAATQTREVADHIQLLGDAAREIGMVTETISSISAQTNLLALNATIESARAGAAGKGFAVVANEIKTLAEQTSAATGDIRKKIASIQNLTENTVVDVRKIDGIVRSVDEVISIIAAAIEEQSAVTKDIARNIVNATGGAKEAAESVDQTSLSTAKTVESMNVIGESVDRLSESAVQMNGALTELNSVSGELMMLVDKFRIG